jgi:protein-L-isoaspartate O-methyltransferase
LRVLAMGLEALEPSTGDAVADLAASSGYVPALLAELVGDQGTVAVVTPGHKTSLAALIPGLRPTAESTLRKALADRPNVRVTAGDVTTGGGLEGRFDQLWLGGALPSFPRALRALLVDPGGRAVTFLGPRFRPQDLVCLVRHGDRVDERRVTRARVPVLAGQAGWLVA